MKRTALIFSCLLSSVFFSLSWAQEAYQGDGFTIDYLTQKEKLLIKDDGKNGALNMFIKEDFARKDTTMASGVNVTIQNFPGDLDQYLKVTKKGLNSAGVVLLNSEKLDENTLYLESKGKIRDYDCFMYSVAIKSKNRVVLATGTVDSSLKEKNGQMIIDTVKSLRITAPNKILKGDGFEINRLVFGDNDILIPSKKGENELIMSIPAKKGLPSSVKVSIEELKSSIEEYIEQERVLAKKNQIKILVEEKLDDNAYYAECSMKIRDIEVFMLSKAIFSDDKVYTASAITRQKLKKKHAKALRECVKSLKLTETKK